jgi:GTP cyclohydrolase II
VLTNKPKKAKSIKSKDGHLLTNEQNRMERWREYFLEILNRGIITNDGDEDEDDDVGNQRELRINTKYHQNWKYC